VPRSGWLATGVIVASLAIPMMGWVAVATGLALVGALVIVAPKRVASFVGRGTVVIVIGAAALVVRVAAGPPPPPTVVAVPDGSGPRTFTVEAMGSSHDGQQAATLTSVAPDGSVLRLAATLPAYPEVTVGDIVTVEGAIRPRPESAYGAFLERIGAIGTLQARTMTATRPPSSPATAVEDARQAAARALDAVLPEPEAGLAAGILIGLRERVDRDLAAAFTTAGVSHVVAISGWNIAIVASVVAALSGRLRRRRRSILTMVVIVAYVVFAGSSASVIRAGAMAGVVLLARESGRAGRAAAALGWAATLLLIIDPALIGDAGFQLSSLATAGLIAWATPLTERIGRMWGGRVPGWLAESLGVSLAAQAATLPVILVSFGRLAILSPLVNLVVVPLVAPAMAAGLLALVGGMLVGVGVPTLVGAVLAAPGWVLLRIMVGIVDTSAAMPFASVTLPPPWATVAAIISAIAIAGVHRRFAGGGPRQEGGTRPVARRPMPPTPKPAPTTSDGSAGLGRAQGRSGSASRSRPHPYAIVALVVAIGVAGAVVVTRPGGVARITVLDVGQGDAILVEGSRGGRLLIDGGPDPSRLLIALDAHVPPWDRRLDGVILTHPHEDHVAGLARLLDRYRVGRVFEPGMHGPGPGYAAWISRLAQPGAPARYGLAAGDRLHVDEIDMRVLWPIRGQVPREPPDGGTGINNVSVVLLGAVGGERFLLAGDVEQAIDPSLIGDRLPPLDFLKIAHHGSKTATTQAFVDTVRPKIAVASAGTGNPYGHPAASTLDRLRAAGSKVYRTDLDGSVVVTFGPDGVRAHAEGGRKTAATSTDLAAVVDPRAVLYRCAISVKGVIAATSLPLPPEPDASWTPPPPMPVEREPSGQAKTVEYHRTDDGPGAAGRRLPPACPRPAELVHASRAGRRRGRGVPRGTGRGQRDPGGPGGRGGRGIAPRRRQGPPRRRSGARPPPWRWLGRLAHPEGPPGTRASGREPPGDAARRW
jgi:competence protein ComEC